MLYGELFKFEDGSLDLLSATDEFTLTSYKTITIPQHFVGKPWALAEVEYGDFRLWWAIVKANKMRIPMVMRDTFRIRDNKPNVDNIITDFYVNRKIIVPSYVDINNYITKVQGA